MVTRVGRLGLRDILFARNGETNLLKGDADTLSGNARAGHDLLLGAVTPGSTNELYGDASLMLGTSRGGNDLFFLRGSADSNFAYGDAGIMRGGAAGGNDRIDASKSTTLKFLVGDGDWMYDRASGGNDFIIGGEEGGNLIFGDGRFVEGDVRTGADTLVGGNNSINDIIGDGWELSSSVTTGRDVLIGGRGGLNMMFGDSYWLRGHGGNDRLLAGAGAYNELHGDARFLFQEGGNDTLVAVRGEASILYGDAYQMQGRSVGGDDRLISGKGDDQMWGDAKFRGGISLEEATEEDWLANPPSLDLTVGGSDVFVFGRDCGDDVIYDFEQGEDIIELRNFGRPWNPWDFDDLSVTSTEDGSVIDFADGSSITVLGVDDLAASDVRFRFDLLLA